MHCDNNDIDDDFNGGLVCNKPLAVAVATATAHMTFFTGF